MGVQCAPLLRIMRFVLLAVALVAMLGSGPAGGVRVDDWDSRAPGPLELGETWRTYPFYDKGIVAQPPAIVLDDGRRALRLATENEAIRVGRPMKIDVRATPWLVWEWKPLVLPDRGDARDQRRNDQAARVMIVFEGMKAIAYLWDTSAPVGAEVEPDLLEMFQRVLIVVRSGTDGVGRWDRQRRNVYEDYVRVFGEEPRSTNWVGFESHSNDTRTRSAALFGAASFEPR
ncbi:MAG: DUF3047 domain-containing protein [Candidatus Rokubacteria bacterium]|nr:DUF3047 domain-containing protein [Candidatus Rokubacteria bacterium]